MRTDGIAAMMIMERDPTNFQKLPFYDSKRSGDSFTEREDPFLARNFPRIGLRTPKGLESVLRALVLQRQLILIKPPFLKGTTIPQACVRWAKME
ncbi:hypothetical protein CDAR_505951 [Caerostris darwini]|uniref:Uncharacterized protein n=1 Tax=Caerostris darwini TaxID=1538125 RepID=A0AAV4WJQ0_9ARAC|nr:hypothetical protein CDAR_505951 [Caerostris darwini]